MRLLRLVSVVPVFALMSCWDFSALNATNTPQFSDGGEPDMYFCDKSPLSIAEDCTDGIDNNDDCRTDCEDPQCATTHLKCVDPTNQIVGYGSKVQMAMNCPGAQTTTAINQNLALNGTCTGCACQVNTNWRCSSTLHVFDDMAKCMGNMERGNASLLSGAGASPLNDCDAVTATAAMGDYFKIDAINSTCPVDPAQPGTKQASSWGNSQKFCSTAPTPTTCQTIACMAAAGNCIAFNGNMASCPSPFAFKEVWYRGYTDNRVCTCSCAAGAGSCAINAGQAQFTTSAMCMTGGGVTTANATQTAACVQAGLGGGNTAAALSFQARPICAASGTAPTDLAAEMGAGRVTLNNPITLCCQQ